MSKSAPFSMRLEDQMKADLQKMADAENRSLTNYIETVLRQHIADKKGKRSKRAVEMNCEYPLDFVRESL